MKLLYAFVGLVVAVVAFKPILKELVWDITDIDEADVAMTAVLSLTAGLLWPLVVSILVGYNFVLKPFTEWVRGHKDADL